MRRDIGFYIDANVKQVYEAYLYAASNVPFERTCDEQPYHTLSFGLNYSFKYNMNGGACHIHFIPCGSGTAVNMRFTVAQLAGARYEKYADDLNEAVCAYLPSPPRPANYSMDDFLKPENQANPANINNFIAPPPPPAPVIITPPTPVVAQPIVAAAAPAVPMFCVSCGSRLTPGGRFCPACGSPTNIAEEKHCPSCNAKVEDGAAFCVSCGTKL